jgi:hypothetical protein
MILIIDLLVTLAHRFSLQLHEYIFTDDDDPNLPIVRVYLNCDHIHPYGEVATAYFSKPDRRGSSSDSAAVTSGKPSLQPAGAELPATSQKFILLCVPKRPTTRGAPSGRLPSSTRGWQKQKEKANEGRADFFTLVTFTW